MNDFFDDLEVELRRATVRRAAAQRAARLAGLRRVPVAVLVAAAVLLAGTALGAGVALRGGSDAGGAARFQPAGWTGLPEAVPPPRDWPLIADADAEDELLAELSVLRRTQRADERVAADVKAAAAVVPQGRPSPYRYSLPEARVLLGSVRRVAIGGWGDLVLVAVRPSEPGPGGRAIAPGAAGDRLVAQLRPARPGLSPAEPVAATLGPPAEGIERGGLTWRVRDGSRVVVVAVVPDGVEQVRLHFRGRVGRYGGSVALVRTLPVRENVAAFVTDRASAPGLPAVTWLDADGRVLSRPPVGPRP